MDDQAAKKVIAAIERLSNRIAKLDETSIESAAIANEACRAAMDAAEATNPKQTAKFLSERVNPVLENFDREFRSSMGKMDEVLSGLLNEAKHAGATFKAAYGDAAFVAREHKRRSRNLLIATGTIGFSVVPSRYYRRGFSTGSFYEVSGDAKLWADFTSYLFLTAFKDFVFWARGETDKGF